MKNGNESQTHAPHAHLETAACDLLNEGKKRVNELFEEGINKVSETEENIKECSDRLLKKVQENPLASVLIAGGIGFLLSRLMKK